MSFHSVTYRLAFVSSLVWCLLIFSPPIALQLKAPNFAEGIYQFFYPICHQIDARSLHLLGGKLAVCARCTAIYFGFFSSVALFPLASRCLPSLNSKKVLVSALLPLCFDVLLNLSGIHESTLLTRLVTGMLLGVVLPPILLPLADEALKEHHSKLRLSFWRIFRHAG